MSGNKLVQIFNRVAVTAYKLLGFAILAFILGGLVAYLGGQGFFLLNEGWVAPTVVAAGDEKVLKLNAELARHEAERDRLLAEKAKLQVQIADVGRIAAAERGFQERFRTAIAGDRSAQARELSQLAELQREYEAQAAEIAESNKAYAGLARTRADALKTASLIDRETWLTQNHQLAQLAHTNIGLEEGRITLGGRLDAMRRRFGALGATLARIDGKETRGPLSADVVLLEQQFNRSLLEAARAEAERDALGASLTAVEDAVARYDRLLEAVRKTPYLEAIEGGLTVAFVPYDNLEASQPGAPLYGCDLGILWCHEVGKVARYLDGEVTLRHPVRNVIVRGQMAVIDLVDPRWVREELLHAGRPPLLF